MQKDTFNSFSSKGKLTEFQAVFVDDTERLLYEDINNYFDSINIYQYLNQSNHDKQKN